MHAFAGGVRLSSTKMDGQKSRGRRAAAKHCRTYINTRTHARTYTHTHTHRQTWQKTDGGDNGRGGGGERQGRQGR